MLLLLLLLTTLLPALAAAASIQQPIIASSDPFSNEYTTLTHDSHPNHKLRVLAHNAADEHDIHSNRESISKYCAGATSGYTGYLSTENDTKHFYFAYFESRSSPDDDPLLMWINGGPGCSSMMGLLMEQGMRLAVPAFLTSLILSPGPCRVNEHGNGTTKNPYSWIEAANVFFLDQPIGVGFSYDSGPNAGHSNGSFAAAEDVYAFMRLWYAHFPESQEKPFSVSGESYGGHYIPIFASHIITENELSIKEGRERDVVPLASVMIGNGIFDPLRQSTSSWDVTCTNVTGVGPVIDAATCEKMASKIDRCEYLWTACYEYPDPLICEAAGSFCYQYIDRPYFETGLNYYDISKPCDGPLCYKEVGAITKYLNRQDVRNAFGVDKAVKRFEACSSAVGRDFSRVGDGNIPTTTYTSFLLNKGLRVLMYVGTCKSPFANYRR